MRLVQIYNLIYDMPGDLDDWVEIQELWATDS